MKTLIVLTLTVAFSFAFAGGSGGGGVVMSPTARTVQKLDDVRGNMLLPNRPSLPKEIIYNIGKQDGVVKFAYGQLIDQKWQVQKIEMSETNLMNDVTVIKALEDSKSVNDWVDLK